MSDYRTQDYSPVSFTCLNLRFEPVKLTAEDTTVHRPWGLTVGRLAVHVVYASQESEDPNAVPKYRVSALECGARIADFDRLELALGFAADVMGLDWSGGIEAAEEIAGRTKEPVFAAHRKWSRALYNEEGTES